MGRLKNILVATAFLIIIHFSVLRHVFMESPFQHEWLVTGLSSVQKNNDLAQVIDEETRFCLIHVGKTAGSKLSCELGMHDLDYFHCAQNHTYAPSALRRAFAGHVHIHRVHHYKCEEDAGVNAFLVTLRNPLDRLISWYYFEHPRDFNGPKRMWRNNICTKKRFHQWPGNPVGCFRNLDDFAQHSIPPHQNTTNSSLTKAAQGCQELAWDVARGEVQCFMHNAMGYGYYVDQMKALHKPNRTYTMLAIRTEHLTDDWDTLEEAFGGDDSKTDNATVTGATRFATTAGTVRKRNSNGNGEEHLSLQGRLNLCSALCEEIQVYKRLLKTAVNLSPYQVEESLIELITSCPKETREVRDCTLKQ
jgi:hypothetical protein